MIVADIMTARPVVVHIDDTVEHARRMFHLHGFHHLLVTNGRRLAGVISDRDLLRHISPFVGKMAERPQDIQTLERRLHQVMTRALITVTTDTEVVSAARTMICNKVSCLPVLDEQGAVAGIVTWRDLVRAFVPEVNECPLPAKDEDSPK